MVSIICPTCSKIIKEYYDEEIDELCENYTIVNFECDFCGETLAVDFISIDKSDSEIIAYSLDEV